MAQLRVGCFYQEGRGTKPDLKKAIESYREAAKQGHPLAQYKLAECYQGGLGIPCNPGEALNWYRRAASQQYPPALQKLSECYADGKGCDKDEQLATFWLDAYEKAMQSANS